MEQHPVPQNVTTFQFRLIGDMTIKQFGYLAGGAILAFISYKLPLPFFFTWPMTVLFGLLGFGFAFVPIEERPMDVWVLSFLRNVYSPTQFIWHRLPASPEPGISQKPLVLPVQKTVSQPRADRSLVETPPPTTVIQHLVVSEALRGLYTQQTVAQRKSFGDMLFGWLDDLFPKSIAVSQPIASLHTPVPVVKRAPVVQPTIQQPVARAPTQQSSEYLDLQKKINALEKQLDEKTKMELKTLDLQKQMTDTIKQKQYMEGELAKLRKQPQPQPKADRPLAETTMKGPTVKIIPPEAAIRAGLPRLTTFSNVVTGIVKDNVGGLLPGVLVTVRDKEGVPLRALKTNKLGQFAASTQLPNGTYIVEIEDPRNRFTFDRAQITLNGAVMPAIEIVAKSKRDINREELSKQIFGQTVNS
jgi:hypothetical protein